MKRESLLKLTINKRTITKLNHKLLSNLKGGTRTGFEDKVDSAELTGCNGRDCF
ncbi:hypothetical protein GTQ40_14250 [Flavobacteriaceae bacterium R38]|nr:hypothetical protein [Flavobacteriaceae bacterium R38]